MGSSFSVFSKFRGKIDRVDVMPLNSDVAMFIDNDKPFSALGHFPIVACVDIVGNPSYLARVNINLQGTPQYCVTTIREGDSTVTYRDELGSSQVTDYFQVLVLRHDPIDFSRDRLENNALRPRRRALDPTGPAYWLRYFPERDPEVMEDATGCLREYESHLVDWMERYDLKFEWGYNVDTNESAVAGSGIFVTSVQSDDENICSNLSGKLRKTRESIFLQVAGEESVLDVS